MNPGMRQSGKWQVSIGAVVGITLLAIIAILVSVFAFGSARPKVADAGETPGYDPQEWLQSAQSAQSEDQALQAEDALAEDVGEEDEDEPSSTIVPMERVLAATDASRAYRAATGPCPTTGATVETTGDGGAGWDAIDIGGPLAVSSVQRIFAGDDGYAVTFALNADDCEQVVGAESFDAGYGWDRSDDVVSQSWLIDPADNTVIYNPYGQTQTAPCPAVRLGVSGSDNAVVACQNGDLFATNSAGEQWFQGEDIVGLDSLAGSPTAFYAAAVDAPGCDGVQVTEFTHGLEVVNTTCAEGFAGKPGRTAVAAGRDDVLWLWAGKKVERSFDRGLSWQ